MAEQTFTRKLSRGDIGWSQSYLVGSPSRSCFLDQFSLTNYFLWLFAIHLIELTNIYTLLICIKKQKLPNSSCNFSLKYIAKVGNTVPDVQDQERLLCQMLMAVTILELVITQMGWWHPSRWCRCRVFTGTQYSSSSKWCQFGLFNY